MVFVCQLCKLFTNISLVIASVSGLQLLTKYEEDKKNEKWNWKLTLRLTSYFFYQILFSVYITMALFEIKTSIQKFSFYLHVS